MNRLVQRFLQSLLDRITASIGSILGSTFSTFRVAQHAEQQSYLEDLARRYESEGKTQLATQLRSQAATLSLDDPGQEARIVFQNVVPEESNLPAPAEESSTTSCDSSPAPSTSSTAKKKRRGKKPATPVDDLGITLE